ncbi:hypothetical protein CRG98_008543 [Punica granatum]|uniref:Uncharacterized protein n=1 Tax=Punica granatum TaxID=22663 RepID=A0A2I0KRF3_PUNGR|nr:hypothetical protein CRG98_008543 [Punica granatum]
MGRNKAQKKQNGKLALDLADLKIGYFGNPRRKTRPFPLIPAVSTPAKSKSDIAQSKRCQGPSPEPSRAVVAASRDENRRPQPRRRRPPDPGRSSLTCLGPFPCFAGPAQKFGPFGPTPQFGPASLPGGFSFGWAIRYDPIHPAIFFIIFIFYREAPQLSGLGKFLT